MLGILILTGGINIFLLPSAPLLPALSETVYATVDTTVRIDTILVKRKASAKDLQLAIDKAALDAREEIARQVQKRLKGLQGRIEAEVKYDTLVTTVFSQAADVAVNTVLKGSRIKSESHKRKGKQWHVTIVVEYPFVIAQEAIIRHIHGIADAEERLRASATYGKLDDTVTRQTSQP